MSQLQREQRRFKLLYCKGPIREAYISPSFKNTKSEENLKVKNCFLQIEKTKRMQGKKYEYEYYYED